MRRLLAGAFVLAALAAGCSSDNGDSGARTEPTPTTAEASYVDCSAFKLGDPIPNELATTTCRPEDDAKVSFGDCADGAILVSLTVDGQRRMEGIIGRTKWQTVAPNQALIRSCGG